MAAIITLTTDFGLQDEYVGVMKGVILGLAPAVQLVDLTHAIAPHDCRQAAGVLAAAYPYFPSGTIHLVVVDPGVGSERRIVLVQGGGHLFLAPDNGVLTPILRAGVGETAYEVTREELFLSPRSHTFHGRDILAPVAGHLAAGLAPAATGPSLALAALTTLPLPAPTLDLHRLRIEGQVLSCDHFGNLITNIDQERIRNLQAQRPNETLVVTVGTHRLLGLQSWYSAVPPQAPLAIIGSRGTLEIAVNQGQAAELLGVGPANKITISLSPLYKEELSI